jgi:hypothetical protein
VGFKMFLLRFQFVKLSKMSRKCPMYAVIRWEINLEIVRDLLASVKDIGDLLGNGQRELETFTAILEVTLARDFLVFFIIFNIKSIFSACKLTICTFFFGLIILISEY